jgi:hypothetical protein
MSQTYKIHRWDPIIFANKGMNPIETPIIYVNATPELIKFAKDNSNALLVKLHIPGSIYDQKRVTAVWSKSCMIPNCRKNFFEKTELYVLILQAPWHGYPDFLGDCEIFGLKGGMSVTPDDTPISTPFTKPFKENNFVVAKKSVRSGVNMEVIAGIIMIIFVLAVTVIYISKN